MIRLQKKAKRIGILFVVLVLIVAICSSVWVFRQAKASKTYDEKVAAFSEENPKLEKGQIVFVGDSITAGYPLQLYYHNLNLKTYNRGISGDTTSWLLTRLQTSLIDIAPSKIVLMIGTNDINLGKSAEEIAQNYQSILDLIASALPDSDVWCVSVIPQNDQYSDQAQENNKRIQETNQKIENLAAIYGYQYVNLYDELTDKDGLLKRRYSTDGLHLNLWGYCVWTDVMKAHLHEEGK